MPPTCARLTGNRNTPVPIMLPATSIVACVSDILRPGALTCVAPPVRGAVLAQALHVVDAVAILHAVRVVAEAREALVPGRQRAQVAEIRTVVRAGRLAGHEHRNAGRVGHDAGREHAIGELIERHVLDLVAHQVLIRGVRRHAPASAASRTPRPASASAAIRAAARTSGPARSRRPRPPYTAGWFAVRCGSTWLSGALLS